MQFLQVAPLPERRLPVVTIETTHRRMGLGTLVTFFALAFGLGWGVIAVLILFTDQVEAIFGEIGYTNPLFIFAVYSPGIAGVFLVWRHYGVRGLRSYLRRLALWRMPAAWWALLVLGIPAVFYLSAVFNGNIRDPFPFSPWYEVIPALLVGMAIGPVEELGWRGVALPLLQRRLAPFWASLVLGTIWGLWHAPAFLLSGTPQSGWSFGPYFVGVLAITIILTPMFNAAHGSILIAALYHFQMNGPAWPDAQPWDTAVFAAVALIIVILNRRAMFARDAGVTSVLMADDEDTLTDARVAGHRERPRSAGMPHPA
jgi:uncharacterized protein